MAINVKDYGAKGDGSVDDSAAIQAAINVAKTQSFNAFTLYHSTVYFPAGYYLINTSIDITNSRGVWLVGDGGNYFNSLIVGNTGSRPMFDFSGSSNSGCENFTFLPPGGGAATNPSTIGIQFALTNNGGLNCGIRNCYFQMSDLPSANGGAGSIGLVNVRSEEFYIHDCLVVANTPIIFSYSSNFVYAGVNYTASSAYQSLSAGTGSMGVVGINGTSLQTLEKRQPALVLIGTNSINFQGYLSRTTANTGSNETAILCIYSISNLKVHATIESFSRALQANNIGFENCELDIITANVTSQTTEVVDLTNCTIAGMKLKLVQPNAVERNRIILYHSPTIGPAAGSIINSEIVCLTAPSNQFIISSNLLKRATNIMLGTSQPFEKRNGRLRQLTNNLIYAGVNNSVLTISIFQFKEARQTTTANNSGFYRVWIDGVIRAGGYGSGKSAIMCFQAQIVVSQKPDGTLDPLSITVITLDQSLSDPTYLNVNGIILDLTFTNGIGTVTLNPRISGNASNEPIYYEGYSELQGDFFVNDPIPLN